MRIELPELCLVALVGASGSGKSSFGKAHFKPTEILSSDYFRGLVSDDETDQSATAAAFDSLYYIAGKRLDAGKLTVIDATNVQKKARDPIIRLAREQNVLAAAIVFDMPAELCIERNRQRPDRNFGPQVVLGHAGELKRSLRNLQKEGFRYVYTLRSPEEAAAAEIVRTKLWNDKRDDPGPFDIIGDVHGCYDELCELLSRLGYAVEPAAAKALPPEGRRALFLGDLCDRGPKSTEVLRLAMNMTGAGHALCIPGNHDQKLLRKLRGADVKLTHGLDRTAAQLERESPEFILEIVDFLDGLVSHYVLDRGRLVAAHAGLAEKLQGRSSGKVRQFCLYGDTTGETDEFGLPVRLNWAEEYRGRALVVYGHIPSREARFLNNTVCIDTGCVFGGALSAFRYPEKELVRVPAKQEYYAPVKPLDYGGAQTASGETPAGALPAISDVLGRRSIRTRFHRDIIIAEESSAAALEIMSRFSADPRWLIYLPPTMSPCAVNDGANTVEQYLEYPFEAFEYFLKAGQERVVCEQKHMGSRAVIVLCRDEEIARRRFAVDDGSTGIIYTRTGRRFFDPGEAETGTAILLRLREALNKSGFWERFSTGWVCLDTELMPWSAKARSLLLEQYAPVGRAGQDGLTRAIDALEKAAALLPAEGTTILPDTMDIPAVLEQFSYRKECLGLYTEAYRRYCWPVTSVDDYRVAPFHILATEGKVWNDENHRRHLDLIREYITGEDSLFAATGHIAVELRDKASVSAGINWWLELTTAGGEGMVVKPLDFIARGKKAELLQPAVKCRGREYLRIIYGPEYTAPEKLARLRTRSLTKKRRLALAEFALGMESLERFVRQEPLHRVHECVFAVLALENETVDPRL